MESTIDFFRFRAREDFITLSQGDSNADAIAARPGCQLIAWQNGAQSRAGTGVLAREYTCSSRVLQPWSGAGTRRTLPASTY